MITVPIGWKVIRSGHGRGSVNTRVEFNDGRGINFSGRLTDARAVEEASKLLRQWSELNMTDEALGAFDIKEVRA